MRSMRLFMVICFVSIAPMTVFGQWTAVSAQKITTRRVISPTGTVLQDTTTTGNYYRSSSGSVATTTLQTSPDGEVQYKAGRLLDNVGLAVYTIDYQNKIAYRNTQLSHPREFQDDPATYSQDHQHSVIDGLKCVVLPIMENGKQVGSVWKSAKYDLVLKMDFSIDNSGEITHVTTQLSGIHLNAKVPAKLFEVPSGFAVMKSPDQFPDHSGSMSMFP